MLTSSIFDDNSVSPHIQLMCEMIQECVWSIEVVMRRKFHPISETDWKNQIMKKKFGFESELHQEFTECQKLDPKIREELCRIMHGADFFCTVLHKIRFNLINHNCFEGFEYLNIILKDLKKEKDLERSFLKINAKRDNVKLHKDIFMLERQIKEENLNILKVEDRFKGELRDAKIERNFKISYVLKYDKTTEEQMILKGITKRKNLRNLKSKIRSKMDNEYVVNTTVTNYLLISIEDKLKEIENEKIKYDKDFNEYNLEILKLKEKRTMMKEDTERKLKRMEEFRVGIIELLEWKEMNKQQQEVVEIEVIQPPQKRKSRRRITKVSRRKA